MSVAIGQMVVCTSDLDRSIRFYTEALGFEVAGRTKASGGLLDVCGVPTPSEIDVCFLANGPFNLELIQWLQPGATGGRTDMRPMNELGMTHLTLRVDDVQQVADAVERLGGTVHSQTRARFERPGGRAVESVHCSDPDGLHVQLFDNQDESYWSLDVFRQMAQAEG